MPTNSIAAAFNATYSYTNTFTGSTGGTAVETASNRAIDGTTGPRSYTYGAGTTANLCDVSASVSATLTAASATYSLTAFPSPNGNQAFVKLRGIIIENNATTTGYILTLDGTVANSIVSIFGASATAKITISPGGAFVLMNPIDGYAVVASTADQLKVTASGGAVPYRIILVGTSV